MGKVLEEQEDRRDKRKKMRSSEEQDPHVGGSEPARSSDDGAQRGQEEVGEDAADLVLAPDWAVDFVGAEEKPNMDLKLRSSRRGSWEM